VGDPLARKLHHQLSGLVVVGGQELPGYPDARVAHHRGAADRGIVEEVVGELVVQVAGSARGLVVGIAVEFGRHQPAGGVNTPNWLPAVSARWPNVGAPGRGSRCLLSTEPPSCSASAQVASTSATRM